MSPQLTEYVVRLIYPSGTVKDVYQTTSKVEADAYIKTSKEIRPRIRHQLGSRTRKALEYSFACPRHWLS